jgi:hypothetical protein
VHSTFLRPQQQCSAPLKAGDGFHGKGVLRLADARVPHGTAASRPTSSPASVASLPVRGYARTGVPMVGQTAVQRAELGVAAQAAVIQVDALGQQCRPTGRRHGAVCSRSRPLRALWARLSLSLRAVAAAAERDTGTVQHTQHTMMLLPCVDRVRAPEPGPQASSRRWQTHSGAFRNGSLAMHRRRCPTRPLRILCAACGVARHSV